MSCTRAHAFELCRTAFGQDATLLDACLRLRMADNGTADPITAEVQAVWVDALKARLAVWEPRGEPYLRFDEAVRELVCATLIEIGELPTL